MVQFQLPSLPEQHMVEQQSRQPKHARAVQICVKRFPHWSFSLEQHWMQHMQQHLLHILLQQLDAAIANISATSGPFGSSSAPGGMFLVVAIKLPKPMPRFCKYIVFETPESTIFLLPLLSDPCRSLFPVELLLEQCGLQGLKTLVLS